MNKIGLDYGTSTTLLSITKGIGNRNAVTNLMDIGGNKTGYLKSSIPSLVAIGRSGQMKFGYEAEDAQINNPNGSYVILRSLKRCLNCDLQTKPEIGKCLNPMVSKYCKGRQGLNIHMADYKVKDLIKLFIEHVMNDPHVSAELKKKEFTEIGIAVPALFSRDPRKTVYEIMLSYFQSKKIKIDVINEPTAAMIAGQEDLLQVKDRMESGIFVLCDIGGGTSDIVLIEAQKDDPHLFIFDPAGIAVAGDDVDNALYNYLDFMGKIDHLRNPATINYEIRRAKELLTNIGRATVFGHRLTKTEFEREVTPVISKIVDSLKQEIMKVHNHYRDTNREFKLVKIYLSGGGSKMPLVKDMIVADRLIGSFSPDVDFIANRSAKMLYGDDTPIVMVAMGASMHKSGIRDSMQHKLPYDIHAMVNGMRKIKISSYEQLPVEFTVVAEKEGEIGLLAIHPSTGSQAYNLGEELFSTPDNPHSVLLQDFIDRSRSISVQINKNNIMSVELRAVRGFPVRRFNLPWQGGIEADIFEKYRKEWRRQHGYA